MKLRLAVVTVLPVLALVLGGVVSPAQAAPAADESYLFVLDSGSITIKPGKGDRAKIIIEDPTTTRFTDRPYHHAKNSSLAKLLTSFGWDSQTEKLASPWPNAAISLGDGKRSQIVELRKVHRHHGVVTLSVKGVRGLKGPRAASGAGTIFIDNASGNHTDLYRFDTHSLWIQVFQTSPTSADVVMLNTDNHMLPLAILHLSSSNPDADVSFNTANYLETAYVSATSTYAASGASVTIDGVFSDPQGENEPFTVTSTFPAMLSNGNVQPYPTQTYTYPRQGLSVKVQLTSSAAARVDLIDLRNHESVISSIVLNKEKTDGEAAVELSVPNESAFVYTYIGFTKTTTTVTLSGVFRNLTGDDGGIEEVATFQL